MTFAKRLWNVRLSLGLTQVEAAKRCGVNPRTLQRWETGTTVPRPRKQIGYLHALGKENENER